jgi:hypothetical protein
MFSLIYHGLNNYYEVLKKFIMKFDTRVQNLFE